MSYARFGWDDSDVYVFLCCFGYLECCACRIVGGWKSFEALTTEKMLAHLEAHRALGHCVPEETFEELRTDAEENDAWIAQKVAS